MPDFQPNTLYYGDNLEVLRDFPSECADLVYLDPPFNSNRSYNVIFRETAGPEAEAQIEAFEDTWHWTTHTAEVFDEVASRGDDVGRLLQAFVGALGHNDMTAYLTMMAPRLIELRRVMKPTASIYLHCDPTASHYLKTLMDAVFGATELPSTRLSGSGQTAHSDALAQSTSADVHDTLLLFRQVGTGCDSNVQTYGFHPYDDAYVGAVLPLSGLMSGRRDVRWGDISRRTIRAAPRPEAQPLLRVAWESHAVWRFSEERMKESPCSRERESVQTRKRTVPRAKAVPRRNAPGCSGLRHVDRHRGHACDFLAKERPGYPTQKPEALLERDHRGVLRVPGDLVLDPFCGCGTATVAAHRLERAVGRHRRHVPGVDS